MSEQVVDAEVVEPEHGGELVPAAPTTLFGTDDPSEVIGKATAVADALTAVIQAKGLYTQIQGKSHVRVEGWTLLGSMLGVTAICTHTEPVDGGYLATVEARACDGRVLGRADALCTKHEKRGPWKSADDYARLSMAQTRATSKALKGPLGFVVSLAGYQTTPAEEMTFAAPDAQTPEPQAKPSDAISETEARALLAAAKESGVPTKLVSEWLQQHGARVSTLTPALAEEFTFWLLQQTSDVPADTQGLAV
jgi:hypothetical protein